MKAYLFNSRNHYVRTEERPEGLSSPGFTFTKPPKLPYEDYLFDGVDWLLISSLPTQPEPIIEPDPIISKLQFMNLFTDAEFAAILTAAKIDVTVEMWVKKLDATVQVDLSDPKLIAGLTALETATLLTASRVQNILNQVVI